MHRRPTLLAAVGVSIAVAVAAAVVWRSGDDGPASSASPEGGPSAADVLIVGDSVTSLSAAEIDRALRPHRIEVVAEPGYASRDLLALVRRAVAGDGPASELDIAVLLVGYNDVRIRDRSSRALTDLLDEAAAFRCGLVLTIPSRPAGRTVKGDVVPSKLVDQFNERLVAAVADRPSLRLVRDWEVAVTEAESGSLLKADGVHPNASGRARLASVLRSAIDDHC